MRVTLTSTSAAPVEKNQAAKGSSTSDFRDTLQSAASTTSGSVHSSHDARSDEQDKAKKKESAANSDTCGLTATTTQQLEAVVVKPVLALPDPQSFGSQPGTAAADSSVGASQGDPQRFDQIAANGKDESQSTNGLPSMEQLPSAIQPSIPMAENKAETRIPGQKEDGSSMVRGEEGSKPDSQQALPQIDANHAELSAEQVLRNRMSNPLQGLGEAASANGVDTKNLSAKALKPAGSAAPADLSPKLQADAPVIEQASQTVSPVALPQVGLNTQPISPSNSREQSDAGSLSAVKEFSTSETRSRKKVDAAVPQAGSVARDSAPDISLPREVLAPVPHLDQVNQQIQAAQAGTVAPTENRSAETSLLRNDSTIASPVQAGADVHGTDTAPLQALTGAHLVQTIHQTEMKLGLNSVEFGSITISTSVAHQVLSAQISLEHPELSRILASHMPAVEEKLGQAYGLHAKVEVRDSSASQSGPRDQSKGGTEPGARRSAIHATLGGFTRSISPTISAPGMNEVARLDVRV